MRINLRRIVSFLLIFMGISLLVYPYISEYLFEHRAESEIAAYEKSISDVSAADNMRLLDSARAYNSALAESEIRLIDPFSTSDLVNQDTEYNDLLKTEKTGIMGYIEIPAIDVYLPIYHGTSEEVLQGGIGHLEGTSLPIGGDSVHAVLTGHTGVNKAKLFTDLTELKEEDLFLVHVLGEVLAYKIGNISVVTPEDRSELSIQKGRDIVTLVTCTPYGINSHRLLVHGYRTAYIPEDYERQMQYSTRNVGSQWRAYYQKAIMMGAVVASAILLLPVLRKKNGLGLLLVILGIGIFYMPDIVPYIQDIHTEVTIKEYDEKYKDQSIEVEADKLKEDVLYQKIQQYNQVLYENDQADLRDPWAYEHVIAAEEWKELENELFGYIEIPVIEQKLPLYMGATKEHMSEGAAIMGSTSMPIGGKNTNCVIAGHRGYNKYKTFFKDIEKLKLGDKIYVTNPWEKLEYIVESIEIVEPDNIESIKIQEGKDMITLLTCHPYASNGRYRYLVYCERNMGQVISNTDHLMASNGMMYESSEPMIDREELFRKVCSILLLIYLFFFIIARIVKNRNERSGQGRG